MSDNGFDFLKRVLFTDIETVACKDTFAELDDDYKKLWEAQCKQSYHSLLADGKTAEQLWQLKAAIHPEFSNVVAISMGYLFEEDGALGLRVKPLYNMAEKDLLETFAAVLARKDNSGVVAFARMAAHNGKKFDYPFLFRRYLIHGITVPDILNNLGKKPWDVPNMDTMELWTSNGTGYPSLDLLCKILGIPMKSILEGSQVHDTFYKEKNVEKIAQYCAADVVALARVFLRIHEVKKEITKVLVV